MRTDRHVLIHLGEEICELEYLKESHCMFSFGIEDSP